MKKLLMLVLIGLLLVLSLFIVLKGFTIGNIEVLSFLDIQARNNQLDETIQEASKLTEKDYKQAIGTVEENVKKLEQEKKEYEDMTLVSSEGDVQLANQLERYSIESLWVKLGNHATSEGVVLKMDVVAGNNSAQKNYDLRFTATGSYISIIDFISDIENDSTLGFQIEEFTMTASGSELQATFVCRDVAIVEVLETQPTITQTNTNNTDTNTTNTTNNTNTTNTTNDTNSTNTANTTNNTNTAQ